MKLRQSTASVVALAITVLAMPGPATARPQGDAALNAFLEAQWQRVLADDPVMASELGDRRYNGRWKDESPAGHTRRAAGNRAALVNLAKLRRQPLSVAGRLDADLFAHELQLHLARHDMGWDRVPLSQEGGVQNAEDLADSLRFETVQDFEDWLARLRALPERLAGTMALMREGIRTKRLLPQVIMNRVPAQFAHHLVDRPAESPFYKPFKEMPAGLDAPTTDRLRRDAKAIIATAVIPAYAGFKRFLEKEYIPACPEATGLSALPGGAKLYAQLAREHTTTPMTPAQIHAVGLAEVARIEKAMDVAMRKCGHTGDRASFFARLRTEKKFYHDDPQALLQHYRSIAKRIDPQLVKLFGTLPRTPYGVEPIPDAIAPDTTTAYYNPPAADGSRAGTFFVNLYKPEVRPTYEMMALSLHEGVPGHHLQIARAMELTGLPTFRKYLGPTAYIEGWGLYAESLGDEMGLYDDPYAKFGQLTYEMWRAVRLVVDTGMHSLGWSRQQAIDYFLAHAAKQPHDVINEIDRYLADPGQALAYKIGELKIKALRAKAKAKLGARFDVRAFHDMLLAEGALPLDILEARVERWIVAGGKR